MTIGGRARLGQRRGLHQVTVDGLGRRIVRGELRAGDALPNETDLGAELDVSRTVVREAIKVLSAKGLVDPRPKTGTRILPRSEWRLIDPDVLGWQFEAGPDARFFRDVSEIRSFIEPGAAALAAGRRTQVEYGLIEELHKRSAAAVEDRESYIRLDLDLHAAILAATHNELLMQMTETITTALQASRAITTRVPGGARSAIALHQRVVDGIRDRDPAAARQAMQALIARAAREIDRLLGAPRYREEEGQ